MKIPTKGVLTPKPRLISQLSPNLWTLVVSPGFCPQPSPPNWVTPSLPFCVVLWHLQPPALLVCLFLPQVSLNFQSPIHHLHSP